MKTLLFLVMALSQTARATSLNCRGPGGDGGYVEIIGIHDPNGARFIFFSEDPGANPLVASTPVKGFNTPIILKLSEESHVYRGVVRTLDTEDLVDVSISGLTGELTYYGGGMATPHFEFAFKLTCEKI